jgi:hypothetical protein
MVWSRIARANEGDPAGQIDAGACSANASADTRKDLDPLVLRSEDIVANH